MKILVSLPSRKRPASFIGVVMSLWRLRSQINDIAFATVCDPDDVRQRQAVSMLRLYNPEIPLSVHYPDEALTLGAKWNLIARDGDRFDAITFMADKCFCLTYGWDAFIRGAYQQQPHRVLWWSCPDDPMTVVPIVPAKWPRPLVPEVFPFWFIDTWIEEVDILAFGEPSLKIACQYGGERLKTTNGRDFAHWCGLYASMQNDRLQQAQAVENAYGKRMPDPTNTLIQLAQRDQSRLELAPAYEREYGEQREPIPGIDEKGIAEYNL